MFFKVKAPIFFFFLKVFVVVDESLNHSCVCVDFQQTKKHAKKQ